MVKIHSVRKRQEGTIPRRQRKIPQKFIDRGEYSRNSSLKTRIWVALSSIAIVISLFSYSSTAKAFPVKIPSVVHLDGSADKQDLPSLNEFIAQVRREGLEPQGLWADGLFAYRVNSACWGCVPDQMNTAAYSTFLGKYHGLFIHSYLGGDKLYSAVNGTRFAIIYFDRVEWFQIIGKNVYEAPPQGETCIYKGEGPFSVWGTDDQNSLTALEILDAHYTTDQLAIQTSVCENGDVGFMVLTASSIGIEITRIIEKIEPIEAENGSPSSLTIRLEIE